MSVLIKGMEMPNDCYDCELKKAYIVSRNTAIGIRIDSREHGCPLVEIPTPHGRLIDADRLIAVMESVAGTQERLIPLSAVLGLIKNSKTIIEAEE